MLKNRNAEPVESQSDIAKALQIALQLNDLRNMIILDDLRYSQRILKNLKEMPKLKPPEKPIKLSEIAPQIREEETETETEEETPPHVRRFRWWRRGKS